MSEALLVPAVMRLLEAYASMSLDRMLRALSQAAPGNEVRPAWRGLGEAGGQPAAAVLSGEGRRHQLRLQQGRARRSAHKDDTTVPRCRRRRRRRRCKA